MKKDRHGFSNFGMLKILICVCTLFVSSFSQEATNESVNPFNQYSMKDAGVNLFSGDASFDCPLYTLPGKNSMNLEIKLRYSSNVYTNVRSRNDKGAAGWVGLGWALAYGSIYCENNGTMTIADDQFWWISQEGVKNRILKKNGKYYLEKNPYWRVEPDCSDGEIIKGWTLTSIDGKKYNYGDFVYHASAPSVRSATRYQFCWPSTHYVGDGFAGTPALYPYQWDLSGIVDVDTLNRIRFSYSQDTCEVKSLRPCNGGTDVHCSGGAWVAPIRYTKAAYLCKIIGANGDTVEFKRIAKNSTEYFDFYQFEPEPDAFMEFFETDLLDSVIVRNVTGVSLRKFKISYLKLNENMTGAAGTYVKSIPTRISEENGNGRVLGKTTFTYYSDSTKAKGGSSYDTNYNYGALATMTTPLGGTVEYTYKRQVTAISTSLPLSETPGLGHQICAGNLSDGKTYVAYWHKNKLDPSENRMCIDNWDGSRWISMTVPNVSDFNHDYMLYPGTDYFVAVSDTDSTICIYTWEGRTWLKQEFPFFNPITAPDFCLRIAIGNGFFVAFGRKVDHLSHLRIYNLNYATKQWMRTLDNNEKDSLMNFIHPELNLYNIRDVNCGGNFFTVWDKESDHPGKIAIGRWNGNDWTIDYSLNGPGSGYVPYIQKCPASVGEGYFAFKASPGGNPNPDSALEHFHLCIEDPNSVGTSGCGQIYPYNWDGEKWFRAMNNTNSRGIRTRGGANAFVGVLAGSNGAWGSIICEPDSIFCWKWNGGTWQGSQLMTMPWTGSNMNEAVVQSEFVVSFTGLEATNNHKTRQINAWRWNPVTNNYAYQYLEEDTIRPNTDEFYIITHSGDDFIANMMEFGQGNGGSDALPTISNRWLRSVWIWNAAASTWKRTIFGPDFNNPPQVKNVFTSGKLMTVVYGAWNTTDGHIQTYYKIQDTIGGPIYSYVVVAKTQIPNFGGPPVTTRYNFSNASTDHSSYDLKDGVAEYNKVEVSQANTGKTVYYFFNHTDANNQANPAMGGDSLSYEMDGKLYRMVTYRADNAGIVSDKRIYYAPYLNPAWPSGTKYDPRVSKIEMKLNGVKSITEYTYNDTNGLASVTSQRNAGGSLNRVTRQTFAYENYPAMGKGGGQAHMLSQPCMVTIGDGAASGSQIRSALATKWNGSLLNGVWLPCSTFAWKMPMNGQGIPDSSLVNFQFTGANDTSWKFLGGITRYNTFGSPVETQSLLRGSTYAYSTTVLGTASNLPIGAVENANFRECGVFTCDYNLNEPGTPRNYFDKNNGWEIGVLNSPPNSPVGIVCDSSPHFGQYSLRIAFGEGLMRNFKVRNNVAYMLSLWAKVDSGSLPVRVEYRSESSVSPISQWPVPYSSLNSAAMVDTTAVGKTFGEWRLIKIPVRAVKGDTGWIRITVGFHGANYIAYVDDVRFGPANSLISSTYYDQMSHLPILTVDANNQPGKKVTYDEFGRPAEILKVDVTKNRGILADKIVERKNYHLMTGSFPDSGVWYKILARGTNEAVQVDSGIMTNGRNVLLWSYQNNPWYQWKFIAVGNGYFIVVSRKTSGGKSYALDVTGGGMSDGTNVQIWEADTNNPNQLWKVVDVDDGNCVLECKGNGHFCLHADAIPPVNGTNADIRNYKAGFNQQWRLIKVP